MSRLSVIARTTLVIATFTAVFVWVYWSAVAFPVYLAESDLYEYYLPIFLSPFTVWSTFEFSGIPAFADIGEPFAYPVYLLFGTVARSWVGFVISAHVIAACGVSAYVYGLTRAHAAAFLAGLSLSLSEAMIERLAHMSTLHALAWMPFMFLCLDRLLVTNGRRWVVLGALAVAMVILAGHPQPALYGCVMAGAYALIGGRVERRPRAYWLRATLVFLLGGLLSAVKLVPFVELIFAMARDEINLGQFVDRGNTPAQMWAALFPTILHDGREAPLYVGLATVIFAAIGTTLWRRQWQVWFWVAAGAVGVLFGLGTSNPIAELVYEYLPLYNKFRVSARHLMITCLALSVLAGYGMHLVLRSDARQRRTWVVLGLFVAVFTIGLWVMTHPPDGLGFEFRTPIAWNAYGLPRIMADTLWTQTWIAAATVLTVAAISLAQRKTPWVALLAIVLCVDLVNAQPFQLLKRGINSVTIPRTSAKPSVHAEQIASDLAPAHQRFLAIGGTHRDALIPATWSRIWRVPIAGGYGPMLLERHSLLSTMGRNGLVRPEVLGRSDQSLNLLAVKLIAVQPFDIQSQGLFEANGITWEKGPLDIPVGRTDCGHKYDRSLTLPLRLTADVAAVHAVFYVRCAEYVAQGQEIGTLSIIGAGGDRHTQVLRAGIEVAEGALVDASVLQRARHQPTARFADPDSPDMLRSLVSVKLSSPAPVARLELTATGFGGWLTLGRLTLVDAEGRSIPQSKADLFLRDPERWQEIRRFRTSRLTDRGRDENSPGEQDYVIYENVHALPRAWLASSVEVMPLDAVLPAIRTSQLPDGRPFVAADTALIAREDGAPGQVQFPGGHSSVTVDGATNGRMRMSVDSDGGGFLVASETYYPGWSARIDGVSTPVYRANLSLQGTVVPPGTHRVEFTFVPRSLYAGAAVSALALCGLGMLFRRREPDPAQPHRI